MSTKKIDIHTHIIPEQLPKWAEKFGYGGFVNLEIRIVGIQRLEYKNVKIPKSIFKY